MKTALVTLCIKRDADNARWMDAGLPSKVKYAKHIGADFINITQPRLGGSVASEKYQIGEMLSNFDRIIYMDADLFIVPDAPNLFDVVPEDHFGIFDESNSASPLASRGQGDDPHLRTSLMAWLWKGWPGCPCNFYANNGLFVCSQEHQWLFDHKGINWSVPTAEQTQMTHNIWQALARNQPQIKVHWLEKGWNWMPHCWIGGPDPGWVLEPQPDPCWIFHYPCHNPSERLAAITALNTKHKV